MSVLFTSDEFFDIRMIHPKHCHLSATPIPGARYSRANTIINGHKRNRPRRRASHGCNNVTSWTKLREIVSNTTSPSHCFRRFRSCLHDAIHTVFDLSHNETIIWSDLSSSTDSGLYSAGREEKLTKQYVPQRFEIFWRVLQSISYTTGIITKGFFRLPIFCSM